MTFFITPFHYTDCFSVRQIGYGADDCGRERTPSLTLNKEAIFEGIVIRSYGGVWAQEKDVYFTQMASTYTASYLPRYPEKSPNDSSVTYNHIKDFWQYNGPATENIRQYQGR